MRLRTLLCGPGGAATAGGGLAHRLFRGSVGAAGIYLLGAGTTATLQFLLAKLLGVSGYGVYAYAFAWIVVLTQFSTLGFETALLRFVAVYHAQAQPERLAGVIRYADRRVLLAGLAIMVIGAGGLFVRWNELTPEAASTFAVGLAVVPVWALLRTRTSVVRALGRVFWALAPNRVVRETVIIAIVLLLLGTSWPADAKLAMTATLVGTALALGAITLVQRRTRGPKRSQAVSYAARHEWRRAALPLLLLTGTEVLLSRSGIVLVGWLLDTERAGIYALAWMLATLTVYPQTAVNALFSPTIAALHARGDHAALQNAITMTSWWIFLAALAIGLPIFLFAEPILSLFGEGFTEGTGLVRILLLGQLTRAAFGSLRQLMAMSGLERPAAMILAISTLLNLALALLLIEAVGLAGAAWAMTATVVFWNLAMAVTVWRAHGLMPSVLRVPPRPGAGADASSR